MGPVTVETVMSCERVGKSELANPAMLTGAASDIFSCVLSMTVSIYIYEMLLQADNIFQSSDTPVIYKYNPRAKGYLG